MSDLTSIEKIKLEKLFGMETGYVLDFSNSSFRIFIFDSVHINIYDDKYSSNGDSKANRLRTFWIKESNYRVGKLISDLLDYGRTRRLVNFRELTEAEVQLFDECLRISERLKNASPVDHIKVIQEISNDKEFFQFASSIRESLLKNKPEDVLDRLHTFAVKYFRELCDKYSIPHDRNTPLHSLYGGYVKYLRQNDKIESQMTERILKSSISIMDSFNSVRNNQSMAHDNSILNYNESLLIVNHVLSSLRFIEAIENPKPENDQPEIDSWDEIPF